MKERPILFSAPMVRAILEGRKTQTRRVVSKQFHRDAEPAEVPATSPEGWQISGHSGLWWDDAGACIHDAIRCPYGQPGDRLWVRETWRTDESLNDKAPSSFAGWPVRYEADGSVLQHGAFFGNTKGKTRVSIHMPRWACRILLEVTGVRVERLQDISEDDVLAEGFLTREGKDAFNVYGSREFFIPEMLDKNPSERVASGANSSAQQAYRNLWESINGAGSWDANPWVWVIEFKKVGAKQ